MVQLQIKIRGRNYQLRTDENPQYIEDIAASLDKKIGEFTQNMNSMPEVEVLTLTAFDILEQSVKKGSSVNSFAEETERLKKALEDAEEKNKQLLSESMSSAEKELIQMAEEHEKESDLLRNQLQEYERIFEQRTIEAHENASNASKDAEEKSKQLLSDSMSSAEKELIQIAEEREKEADELRNQLQEYERILEQRTAEARESASKDAKKLVEEKEQENLRLQATLDNFEKTFADYSQKKESEIIRLQEQIEELKLKLASKEDGQISLM